MPRFSLALAAGFCVSLTAVTALAQDARRAPSVEAVVPATTRAVDLAICLDTSGSMDGLIDSARQKIWEIVNDLATAKPRPRLRVALLSYGNDGYESEQGWVRVLVPLTDDLDEISARLFELKTNGGTELVARVVKRATDDLSWSTESGAMKLLVVAGNESADQDKSVKFQDACAAAIGKGIMINAIYCGNPADQLAPDWRQVAKLADGEFAAIDHTQAVAAIATPQDDELARLGAEVNATYIPFGEGAWTKKENQTRQDANAAGLNAPAAAQRAQTKGGEMYHCSWDLVDACTPAAGREATVKIEEVKEADLPENMKSMTMDQRKAYVASMLAKREEIKKKIADLGKLRDEFVAKERKRLAEAGDASFDAAIRGAVRKQAQSKGFAFEK